MKISITVDADIHPQKYVNKIMNDETFWRFAAAEWHRLYQDWVPYRTGNLYDDVTITPGVIEHKAPYARYVYEGERMHFNRGQHAHASARWDQKAEPTQKPKLISTLQRYIDSGRLNLND